MDLQGANASETSGASLQLLESASDVPKSSSSNLAFGANIDTYA